MANFPTLFTDPKYNYLMDCATSTDNQYNVRMFDTKAKFAVFCAFIGFKNNLSFETPKTDKEILVGKEIPGDVFVNQNLDLHIYMLSLLKSESIDYLKDDKESKQECMKCLREFANGGLSILDEQITNSPNDWDSVLINYIVEIYDDQTSEDHISVKDSVDF